MEFHYEPFVACNRLCASIKGTSGNPIADGLYQYRDILAGRGHFVIFTIVLRLISKAILL